MEAAMAWCRDRSVEMKDYCYEKAREGKKTQVRTLTPFTNAPRSLGETSRVNHKMFSSIT